jgi:hypothetical protein
MTFLETPAMNARYNEAEAVLIAEPPEEGCGRANLEGSPGRPVMDHP